MIRERFLHPCSNFRAAITMSGPEEHNYKLLLAISKASTLAEALEVLVETSRTANGRSELATKNIMPVVLPLIPSLTLKRDLLILSLKLVRNLCAGERANQDSFIKENGPEVISFALFYCGLNYISDHEVMKMGLQALGNAVLGGLDPEHVVWRQFFPHEFEKITTVQRVEVCDPLCMILYHCCHERSEVIAEITSRRGLSLIGAVIQTASAVGFKEDWLKRLLSVIYFEQSSFRTLFSMLRPDSSSFSQEQVFLLNTLSEMLAEEVPVTHEVALCILNIFHEASNAVPCFPAGGNRAHTGLHTFDVLRHSLIILRDISAYKYHIADSLISSGLVDKLLDFLCSFDTVYPYKGFRRDVVSVLANCTFRRKGVQDRFRERNCIHLLLGQCVVDDDEPFLREWAIWSIRNLLKGNLENQQVVAELELQEVVDLPEFTRSGLRIAIDQND